MSKPYLNITVTCTVSDQANNGEKNSDKLRGTLESK